MKHREAEFNWIQHGGTEAAAAHCYPSGRPEPSSLVSDSGRELVLPEK